MSRLWKICVLLLGLGSSGLAEAVLTIRITEGTERALPIAVVPFAERGVAPPVDIAAVVAADLARSGRFRPMPVADMPQRPANFEDIRFQDWQALNMDSLVLGQVRDAEEGVPGERFDVDFRLVDVYAARYLTGYNTQTTAADMRTTAHHIADIVYEALTGQPGAFASRIAYVTRETGPDGARRYTLQVADSDGHDPRVVLRSSEPLLSPAWSPDGRRLAYVAFEQGRDRSIYVQEVATGQRERVAAGPGLNSAPAWSPDGRRLAVTLSRQGNADIYVLDLASGRRQRVTDNPGIDTEASWMPDGKSLVFTSDRGGSPQVYQVDLEGGAPRRLTFDEGNYNARPRVSPDGRLLAMVNGGPEGYNIAVKDLRSGEFRLLTRSGAAESPSFAPNSGMIIYATHTGTGSGLAAVSVDGRMRQQLALDQGGEVLEPAWGPSLR